MNIEKIKDNSYTNKEKLSKIEKLVGKIADKTLEQLEHEDIFIFPERIEEAEDISYDQIIIQSTNDSYRSSNIMGFIGYGDERLIIESRFCNGEDYFFQYLIDKALKFPNIVDLMSNTNTDNKLFNFLLFLFPYYLKTALRKGIFKKYIRNNYNDNNIKGSIDFSRHIQKNTPFVGNIAYSRREFSYDNYLTELIRHTIEFIKSKAYGNKILVKIREETKYIINATPKYNICDRQKIINNNKNSPIQHAYYKEYTLLQKICLLILQYQNHNIGSGSKQIYGILFDGSWLWEEYICSLINDKFYHPMNKSNTGTQKLFDNNIGLIYPDFISRDSNNRVIADAKYKPICNIGNKDYLQLLAYMFRFDAKNGYYLYPEIDNNCDLHLKMNKGLTYENNVTPRDDISITKHGFKIPIDANNYTEFTQKMNESEKEFKNVFNKLLFF